MSKFKIVAFGDSLTAGSALKAGDENWTDIIAKRLNADVINSGIGGHTSAQGLSRIEKDVISHSPDIVLICFGMNDHVIINTAGATKVSEQDFYANLVRIINRCREINASPLLITPNAIIEEYYYTRHNKEWYKAVGGANKLLSLYCSIIHRVANEYDVPVADIFAESRQQNLYTLLRTPQHGNFEDGVHPYGNGITLYADIIERSLKCYLK